MQQSYFAFIGDIVNSRGEAERGALQRRLNALLSELNAEYADRVAADFLITLGDEFQGLLFAAPSVDPLVIASRIIDGIFPARIRVSVGFGTMATDIRRDAAIGADGPAYHRARSGLERIRAEERKGASRIILTSERADIDEPVNALLLLLSAIEKNRSERQNTVAALYMKNLFGGGGRNQTQLASSLGITQGTFNISLTASCAREYAAGLAAAEKLLSPLKEPKLLPPI